MNSMSIKVQMINIIYKMVNVGKYKSSMGTLKKHNHSIEVPKHFS